MKADECALCGMSTRVVYAQDAASGKTLYGLRCESGHEIGAVFGTKNRAVQAWNECQGFIRRYSDDVR